MPASILRTIVIVAVISSGSLAVAAEQLHHPPSSRYSVPAAPYKGDRLSSARGEAVLNVPGQTTVLTRQVLDDMNATSLRDALRSTAGVTVGR